MIYKMTSNKLTFHENGTMGFMRVSNLNQEIRRVLAPLRDMENVYLEE